MVANGEFVVPGRDGAELLEPVDQALHPAAFAIGGAVEARVAALRAERRADGTDAAAAQVAAHRRTAVALITGKALWSQPWPPPPAARHVAARQQLGQRDLLVALTTRYDEDDGLALSLRAEVDLRAEAAPTPAERLVTAPFFAPAAC